MSLEQDIIVISQLRSRLAGELSEEEFDALGHAIVLMISTPPARRAYINQLLLTPDPTDN